MPYNYTTAKDVLTEAEKARIICIFLNMETSTIMSGTNWANATAQMGSASVESMKRGFTNTLKKLDKVDDSTPSAATAAAPIPKKKATNKKRKLAAESVTGDDDDKI